MCDVKHLVSDFPCLSSKIQFVVKLPYDSLNINLLVGKGGGEGKNVFPKTCSWAWRYIEFASNSGDSDVRGGGGGGEIGLVDWLRNKVGAGNAFEMVG